MVNMSAEPRPLLQETCSFEHMACTHPLPGPLAMTSDPERRVIHLPSPTPFGDRGV